MKESLLNDLKQLKSKKRLEMSRQDLESKIEPQLPARPDYSISSMRQVSLRQPIRIRKPMNEFLFTGLSFMFPIFDLELTPKQAEILIIEIIKRNGVVYDKKISAEHLELAYVLCSRKVNIQKLEKDLSPKFSYIGIVDFHFIQECLAEEDLVRVGPYTFKGKNPFDTNQVEDEVPIEPSLLQEQSDSKEKRKRLQGPKAGRKMRKLDELHSNQGEERKLSPNGEDRKSNDDQMGKEGNIEEQKVEIEFESAEGNLEIEDRRIKQKSEDVVFLGDRGQKFSMNKYIADELMKLQKIYESERDKGRKIAYLRAANSIRTHPIEIKSKEDLKKINGIGIKIEAKIVELIETGHMHKLEELQTNPKYESLAKLSSVWGIGPAKAKELLSKGIDSMEKLVKNQHFLNRNQKIGVKYYEDFCKRISRGEAREILRQVEATVIGMAGVGIYELEIAGSYRRGKESSGDIDIILTRLDGRYEKNILPSLVDKLYQEGYLSDHLTLPKGGDEKGCMSYMGVWKSHATPELLHRRIDIKFYPRQLYAFALLYFTGSDHFNRSMRLEAKKKGFTLSDRGLIQFERKPGQPILNKEIKFLNERAIFDFLGFEYKSPQLRNI